MRERGRGTGRGRGKDLVRVAGEEEEVGDAVRARSRAEDIASAQSCEDRESACSRSQKD